MLDRRNDDAGGPNEQLSNHRGESAARLKTAIAVRASSSSETRLIRGSWFAAFGTTMEPT
jgi:hypothetical protein